MVRREARAVAEDGRMELEAASALAGLARCPAVDTSTRHSEEQSVATAISNSEKISEEIVEDIPRQVCSTSCKSNRVRKLKTKSTEAEKEAQKVRRVLANRESARETIRRRQASYVELTGKATELMKENEILKKEMEVAVKEYNSLRDTNEVFKAQLAKLKRIGVQSEAERCSPIPSMFLHHQPSIVPCFWPSINFQSQFQNDASSSHFQMPAGQGAPLFLLPVPCMLPFLGHQNNALDSHCNTNDRRGTTHPSTSCLCPEQNTRAEASDSKIKPISVRDAAVTRPEDGITCNVNVADNLGHENEELIIGPDSSRSDEVSVSVASAAANMGHALLGDENEEPVISPDRLSDEGVAATVARRRRKELIKLKNKHCDHLDLSL